MTVTITPAGPAAASVLAALHAAAFDAPWDAHWSAESFAGMLASGHQAAIAGMQADVPVGFVQWRTVAGEAEIISIGVLPQARGSGIGRTLLAHAVTACRAAGAGEILLEVAALNINALQMYTAAGFQLVGRRRDYYIAKNSAQKCDALIMTRRL